MLCAIPLLAQAMMLIAYRDLPSEIPMQLNQSGVVWAMPTWLGMVATAAISLTSIMTMTSIQPTERNRKRLTAVGLAATLGPTLWCVGVFAASGAVSLPVSQVVGVLAVGGALVLGLVPRRLVR